MRMEEPSPVENQTTAQILWGLVLFICRITGLLVVLMVFVAVLGKILFH